MKDFKIGGKVTINKDESYIIIDIIKINNKIYYLCSTNKKPVTPKVFEREEEGEKVFIKCNVNTFKKLYFEKKF